MIYRKIILNDVLTVYGNLNISHIFSLIVTDDNKHFIILLRFRKITFVLFCMV